MLITNIVPCAENAGHALMFDNKQPWGYAEING